MQSKLKKWSGSVLLIIFLIILYQWMSGTQDSFLRTLKGVSNTEIRHIEFCEISGSLITDRCVVISERNRVKSIKQNLRSSVSARPPGHTKAVKEVLLRLTLNENYNKKNKYCFIGIVFEGVEENVYLNDIEVGSSCLNSMKYKPGSAVVSSDILKQ